MPWRGGKVKLPELTTICSIIPAGFSDVSVTIIFIYCSRLGEKNDLDDGCIRAPHLLQGGGGGRGPGSNSNNNSNGNGREGERKYIGGSTTLVFARLR